MTVPKLISTSSALGSGRWANRPPAVNLAKVSTGPEWVVAEYPTYN